MPLIVIALATGCWTSPRAAPPAIANSAPVVADDMSGDYRQAHSVRMVCDGGDDGWCEEDVVDTLSIVKRDGGALQVAIELVQTNGHTCSFEGTLAPTASHAWRFVAAEGADEGPCELSLVRRGRSLEISSEGCRYYCGARAVLDARFRR